MMKNRIVKALVIFFLYLSIYTYMCIGGSGWFSRSPRRRRSYRCPGGNRRPPGGVGRLHQRVCLFGNKLDRIHAAEQRTSGARAELLAAWRR